jgi:hypothetical protein
MMGYETLCYALSEQRDLVAAISQRLIEIYRKELETILQFDRVKAVWGSDDLGFKTSVDQPQGSGICLSGHKLLAKMSHRLAGHILCIAVEIWNGS